MADNLIEEIMVEIGSNDEKLRSEIEQDLKKMSEYGVPPEQARNTILNKYSKEIEKKIGDLAGGEKKVSLIARVLSLNHRNVMVREEEKTVYFGFLEDTTGTCSYSVWQEPNFQKGDVIKIKNSYVTEWQDVKRINIRNVEDVSKTDLKIEIKREVKEVKIAGAKTAGGRIKVAGKLLSLREFDNDGAKVFRGTICDETGCSLIVFWEDFKVKENDCVLLENVYASRSSQISVSEDAKVKKIEDIKVAEVPLSKLIINFNNVTTRGRVFEVAKGEITRGMITDGKTAIPFTSWNELDINDGDVLLIEKCGVRRYMGSMRLNLDKDAVVKKIEDKTLDHVKIEEKLSRIADIEASGTVEGCMIDIKEPSGLLKRCTECNRVLKDDCCFVHGKIEEPRIDLRVKGLIDDGSDCAILILNRSLTEALVNKKMEDYEVEAKKAMSMDVVLKDLEKLLFNLYKVSGFCKQDEIGRTLIATKIEPLTIDVKEEAEKLLAERGETI